MAYETGRLKELFLGALERVDPEARQAFLLGACGSDLELLQRLKRLLRAHDDPASIVRSDLPDGQSIPLGDCPGETAQQILADRYKLVEMVGEGGMGTVWIAEQFQPIRRMVAVKLIKPGMDSRSMLARFEAERQALAVMDHPNIAKVLDGSTTGNGRPYFVMEYVQGTPITEYCDEQKLGITDRLRLFISVCQAVHHAHQKGIIHRDLKPGNILVATVDGQPVPKIIDFGIAKLFHQSIAEGAPNTVREIMLGTPLYMSPEQADNHDGDVDTRTDIYSLGVILYELLTGSTPLERQQLQDNVRRSWVEIIRVEEPPRPSDRIRGRETRIKLAGKRQIEPLELARLVRGELDWIVMKCLEKERGRRYETAIDLASDVRRFLADEIVEARPPSSWYRWQKFLRRHRGPVIAASAVLLALIIGVIATSVALLEAQRQRHHAVIALGRESQQRQRAELAEAVAGQNERQARAAAESARIANEAAQSRLRQIESAYQILGSVFEDLNPLAPETEGKPLQIVLGERLDRAAAALESSDVDDDVAIARLQRTLGNSLLGLGQADKAIAILKPAHLTFQASLGVDHVETLACANSLANAYRDDGQFDLALPIYRATLESRQRVLGDDDPNTLNSMAGLANCLRDTGQFDLALDLLLETLELRESVLGLEHPHTLVSMNDAALGYQAVGDIDSALALLEDVVRLQTNARGDDDPSTIRAVTNLGAAYEAAGLLDRAVPLFETALKRARVKWGPDHRETLNIMSQLARGFRDQGQFDRAAELFDFVVPTLTSSVGPNHPQTLNSLNDSALLALKLNRPAEARAMLERLVTARTQTRGPEHPLTLSARNNLAMALVQNGDVDRAVEMLEEIARLQMETLGPDHPQTLVTDNNLAQAYQKSGRIEQAIRMFDQVFRARSTKLGRDHPATLISQNNLASAYYENGDSDQAIPLLEDAVSRKERSLGPSHPGTLLSAANLGVNYCEVGRYADAYPLLDQAWKSAADIPALTWTGDYVAECLIQLNRRDAAQELLDRLLRDARTGLPADSPELALRLTRCGWGLTELGRFAEGEACLREALAIRDQAMPDNWLTDNTRSLLGAVLLAQAKYDQAEPLLLAGQKGLQQRMAEIPPAAKFRVAESISRLIELYDRWGRADESTRWRKRRDEIAAGG